MSVVEHVFAVPPWLSYLVNDVLLECITPLGFIGQIGYRYWGPDEPGNPSQLWVIAAYPTANVIRGAHAQDGAVFVSGFQFDIGKLFLALTDLKEITWNNPTTYTGALDGPELSLKGEFMGKQLWLRFFNVPPPDEAPAFAVNPQTSEATELVNS